MRSNENVPVRFRTQQRAKYCLPRPTVLPITANCIAAKMCLRDLYQTYLRIPDHRRQEFQQSLTLLSFNSIQKASRLTATASFPRVFFQLLAIFKATSKLFSTQGYFDYQNGLDSSSIFFQICRFRC